MARRDTTAADLDLVQRCIRRDDRAMDELVTRFSGLVYFAICHVLKSRGLRLPDDFVADVHNAVFLSLLEDDHRRLRRFSGRCKLSHWIKVVTVNRTIDCLRQRKPTVPLDDPDGPGSEVLATLHAPGVDPEEAAMRAERRRLLDGVVRRLPAHDRLLIRLIYVDGEPGEAVARMLGTTVGAVYTRKNRLRKRLARLLRQAGANGRIG